MYTQIGWLARIATTANRWLLTPTGATNTYDLSRVEGAVTQAGTAISPTNLNKMDDGIVSALRMAIWGAI